MGTAALTGFFGLSMALGAFLAGLLIAETEFRHQVKIDIEPFKGLMLGLFFLSVGMGIDWRVVIDNPLWIIASASGLILIKIAINFALCLAWRLPRHRAAEVAITLGQAGEFGFLIVGLSVTVGLLAPATGQFMVIVVGLTMIATPGLDWLARRVAAALERGAAHTAAEAAPIADEIAGHVILAGFGRVGRTIASVLDRQDIRYVAIDRDPELVRRAAAEGRPLRLGDASRLDVLRAAGLGSASAVVVTIGDMAATQALTGEIRRHGPGLAIFARARDADHAGKLLEEGANVAGAACDSPRCCSRSSAPRATWRRVPSDWSDLSRTPEAGWPSLRCPPAPPRRAASRRCSASAGRAGSPASNRPPRRRWRRAAPRSRSLPHRR